MELAEVKKYFENAKEVQDHAGDKGFIELEKIELSKAGRGSVIQNPFKKNWLVLWHPEKGFAKILTTKEPSFSITKDQLRQLTDPKVKEWFPEVFEVKLEVGKWYKNLDEGYEKSICYAMELHGDNHQFSGYGFDYELKWFYGKDTDQCGSENWVEATNEEVFEALKNEAVKRGFVEGAYVKGMDTKESCELFGKIDLHGSTCLNFGYDIFRNGKWATIIQTITKSEAEKLLNKKIID